MFYESAQESMPTRKGKMSDILVNNTCHTLTHGDVRQEDKISSHLLSSVAPVHVFACVVCVGGGRGFE